ncbi:MAG: DUF1934 domain-containing protein [Firmicutes bacterium]|nr:DUF1934 domain-containing protein [Bacillota bacterium]
MSSRHVMEEVMLKIKGTQFNSESGEEVMEFATEAKLYRKNDAIYLIYDESEFSGMPGCRTRLRLKDDEVQMKRVGKGIGDGHELKFRKGERFTTTYHTPFGPIELEVLTNELENTLLSDDGGQINIDYNISLKGLSEGRNKLNITLM